MPIGQPVDVLMRPAAGVTPDQRLAFASAHYRISGPTVTTDGIAYLR